MAKNICVRFATNRRPIGSPVQEFGSDLSSHEGTDLRYGSVNVAVTDSGVTYVKNSLTVADEQLYAGSGKSKDMVFGSAEVNDGFRKDMKQGDALGILHGFFNTFEASIEGSARVLVNANVPDVPLFVFAWPSKGKVTGYLPDRKAATRSGEAFARAVQKFIEYVRSLSRREFCNHEVNLLAHSMGNYVLRFGLQAIRERHPELLERQIFSDVILVAADEDADALEREDKLQLLSRLARRITVYYTDLDGALWTSDNVKFNPDRLGRRGPSRISGTPDNVFAVDVTAVIQADKPNRYHGYHRSIPRVGDDIRALLNNVPTYDIPSRVVSREHPRRFSLV